MNPTVAVPSVRAERTANLHDRLRAFPAELFQFDPRIKQGWLSDRYFIRTALTLAHANRDPQATLQLFAKDQGIVAGIYECIRLLQTQLADSYRYGDIHVETLLDGDPIEPWETVMHITGPYRGFAHLETPLLGVLARRTLVASNVRAATEAANGKPVIFMSARHDDWRVQTPDGYAAQVGGTRSVSSDAGGAWWGAEGVGTMPHAMIAAFDGDVVEATLAFTRYIREHEPGVSIVSLVDYENDVVRDAVAVAHAMRREFGDRVLAAVRVDTSEKLIDESLIHDPEAWGRETLTGVNSRLVRKLRWMLDDQGFDYVGIVASGGFTPGKIRRFEAEGVPVTAYGVGSSLLGHNTGAGGLLSSFDFTADIVRVDGDPQSKVGRAFRPNPRLVPLDWGEVGG
jgi:nicotinate phosphoribosyltransferase